MGSLGGIEGLEALPCQLTLPPKYSHGTLMGEYLGGLVCKGLSVIATWASETDR